MTDVFDENTFKIRRTETKYRDNSGKYVYDIKEFPKSEAGVRIAIVPDDYQWLISKIKVLNPFSEYVFLNNNGERMTTNCIRRRLDRICKKLNISASNEEDMLDEDAITFLDNSIDEIIEEELEEIIELAPSPIIDDPNRAMTPDEIAALIASVNGGGSEPEPEPIPEPEPVAAPVIDDPNRAMTPDEIAALIASMK